MEISRMVNRRAHKEKPFSKTTDYFNFYLLPNPNMVIVGNHITDLFKDSK